MERLPFLKSRPSDSTKFLAAKQWSAGLLMGNFSTNSVIKWIPITTYPVPRALDSVNRTLSIAALVCSLSLSFFMLMPTRRGRRPRRATTRPPPAMRTSSHSASSWPRNRHLSAGELGVSQEGRICPSSSLLTRRCPLPRGGRRRAGNWSSSRWPTSTLAKWTARKPC